jgi:hypothetical protein
MQPEPYIENIISNLDDSQLRDLCSRMLQRLVQVDGAAFTLQMFPALGPVWEWPMQNWNPNAL